MDQMTAKKKEENKVFQLLQTELDKSKEISQLCVI